MKRFIEVYQYKRSNRMADSQWLMRIGKKFQEFLTKILAKQTNLSHK